MINKHYRAKRNANNTLLIVLDIGTGYTVCGPRECEIPYDDITLLSEIPIPAELTQYPLYYEQYPLYAT